MSQAIAFINPRVSTNNVGDHFIEDSVKRILDFDPQRSIDIDPRKPLNPGDIERINECDVAVIVGTNLWYRHIAKLGRWMISVEELRQIKIPFVPLGVGTTQHRHEVDTFAFDEETVLLLQEIHNKCEFSSARDPRTYDTLKKAGIENVRMTGCPTLYRSLKPEWALNKKNAKEVVITARKGHDRNINIIVDELIKRGMKPVLAAQKIKDLYCARRRLPLFQRKMDTLYEFDIKPYQALVDNAYGAIGWRLHGNMFHLAHGNPTMFFANCSRCLSFSEAFELPCIYAEDKEVIAKADLIESVERFLAADYFDKFIPRYAANYQEMASFLDANGLRHNLTKC
ncbi:polysaccharide pyruvyl transferase family protein [Pseudomaricurvus alkylphenolicus]|jgi:polysaccharide pyruvyl transferase WcaK-like protein|uniref:polysaccharide pyruvyl transferase family protein n=1 Tax=Pseudomaricurvus alkylphenolicus TaxID=1306991 RepID=UPI00141D7E31|nr:polysaccharide pyruvyl transferase family protein [Pseudomaricurvus alkylphenolicus]NIB42855.1 polysaccharide pyruvyl transferase family protein [Pseudomaricurvus alkylphenolicus]